jgi:hypothetical protein
MFQSAVVIFFPNHLIIFSDFCFNYVIIVCLLIGMKLKTICLMDRELYIYGKYGKTVI